MGIHKSCAIVLLVGGSSYAFEFRPVSSVSTVSRPTSRRDSSPTTSSSSCRLNLVKSRDSWLSPLMFGRGSSSTSSTTARRPRSSTALFHLDETEDFVDQIRGGERKRKSSRYHSVESKIEAWKGKYGTPEAWRQNFGDKGNWASTEARVIYKLSIPMALQALKVTGAPDQALGYLSYQMRKSVKLVVRERSLPHLQKAAQTLDRARSLGLNGKSYKQLYREKVAVVVEEHGYHLTQAELDRLVSLKIFASAGKTNPYVDEWALGDFRAGKPSECLQTLKNNSVLVDALKFLFEDVDMMQRSLQDCLCHLMLPSIQRADQALA